MNTAPTFGSLFAGIGGFDLGLERAGLKCEWQVEINPFCRRVLAKHWPQTRRHDDVRTFPLDDGTDWRVDVICGGFPCKQTSTAAAIHGRRIGLAGKDSGLWRDMHRIIRTLGPRCVIVENPPSKWIAQVSSDLEGAGYRCTRLPATASDFGALHLRRRMFVVAYRNVPGLAQPRPIGSSEASSEPGRTIDRDAWLSSLPRVLRVDDGVPGGLDRRERITAVGNAVVPHVAEWIGRRVLASLGSQSEVAA